MTQQQTRVFTPYQVFIIAILATLQFTIILDFMVLSPLGAMLLEQLHIGTAQFGLVVSAYAFTAGVSGLLAAGFADRFDRKKLLLFFYTGFMIGTLCCALAPNYHLLLMARIITGLFGGVVGSIGFAIITDLFKMEVRGRVMGFVQMAFGASQVLGIPIGLLLANRWGWHSPFWLICGFGTIIGILVAVYMKPVNEHLKLKSDRNALQHLYKTVTEPNYLRAYLTTILLSTGGFMLMPFASAFSIHNLGLTMAQLPTLYVLTGIFSFMTGPLIGKYSDRIGKYRLFLYGSVLGIAMVAIYTNRGITPLWICVIINMIMFAGISARMISASALMSAIPAPHDRGAYMSISSSIQQLAGGVASSVAGMIVYQAPNGDLQRYPVLGLVVISSMIICLLLMYQLHLQLKRRTAASQTPGAAADPHAPEPVAVNE